MGIWASGASEKILHFYSKIANYFRILSAQQYNLSSCAFEILRCTEWTKLRQGIMGWVGVVGHFPPLWLCQCFVGALYILSLREENNSGRSILKMTKEQPKERLQIKKNILKTYLLGNWWKVDMEGKKYILSVYVKLETNNVLIPIFAVMFLE